MISTFNSAYLHMPLERVSDDSYHVCNIEVHLFVATLPILFSFSDLLAVPEWGATEGEVVGPETTHQLVG